MFHLPKEYQKDIEKRIADMKSDPDHRWDFIDFSEFTKDPVQTYNTSSPQTDYKKS